MKRWPLFVVAVSIVSVGVAVIRPEVAHLALQALLAAVVVFALIAGANRVLGGLPASDRAAVWRPRGRPKPPLPHVVATVSDSLRARGRYIPAYTAMAIAEQFEARLALRHRIADIQPKHEAALRRLLSPHAYALVTSRREWGRGGVALSNIPRSWLTHLLDELETL